MSAAASSSSTVPGLTTEEKGQYRKWFCTINNPPAEWTCDDGAAQFWRTLTDVFGTISGGVYQIEKGEQGTPHVQGVFHLGNKCRPITMKNKMRSKKLGGWIAPCIDFTASIKYCTKEEGRQFGPFWYGDVTAAGHSTQGKRTDLVAVAEAAAAGASLKEIAVKHPTSFIKYHTGIQALLDVTSSTPPRNFKTVLHMYYGAAGTGKTRRATYEANQLGETYVLSLSKDSHVQWWRGYTGQESVMIDDYNGELPLTEWFKMTDRYEYKVRVDQNAWRQFTSRHIFVTCNAHPHLLYAKEFLKNADWKQAFDRRIDELVEFKEGTVWEEPKADEIVEDAQEEPDRSSSPYAQQMYMQDFHETVCMQHKECGCVHEYQRKFG